MAAAGASRADLGGQPQAGPAWPSRPAPPRGADAQDGLLRHGSGVLQPRRPGGGVRPGAAQRQPREAGLPRQGQSAAAGSGRLAGRTTLQTDRHHRQCLATPVRHHVRRRKEDDAELAEIEAFADEQARRFMPTIDRRRARRTATASVGRAAQADSINFQMKTSALWQRRGSRLEVAWESSAAWSCDFFCSGWWMECGLLWGVANNLASPLCIRHISSREGAIITV
ncbi:unnamed protein product [Prorocentrum cordatum]|uniref:Uncharacterized protein n=1 Tax=Prorocentrum cordatum TaxID=2364126 RepID=A0ABN9RX07_9DINO|nr:unnamed protein product [Polarella glacialis]